MKRADFSPVFITDDFHIIHLSTRLASKRGDNLYRGFGCFAGECIHPDFLCSQCVCSFSTLYPFK